MIVNLIRNGVEEQAVDCSFYKKIESCVNAVNNRRVILFPEDANADLKLVFIIHQELLDSIPYSLEIKADCKNNPRISASFRFYLADIRESEHEVILTYKA